MSAVPVRILSVVGARPNFMKVAPIIKALARTPQRFSQLLVHTGQHYDELMSGTFFRTLGMPKPDVNLQVQSGGHAEQTGWIMIKLEPVMREFRPDLVIVVGDVTSTLAAALTAKKLGVRVAHVEAGLRSGDRTMPEEINRLATDAISDDLFTTDRLADANLVREGVAPERIHLVGNVMIDTLLTHLPAAEALDQPRRLGLASGGYATMTLHRPSNVEHAAKLAEILDTIQQHAGRMPIVFPIHPRTRQRVVEFGLADRFVAEAGRPGIWMTEPLGYLEMLGLNAKARIVLTDSGGLQEETTILGVPCVTIRDNTERPITVEQGTNRLAGTQPEGIARAIGEVLKAAPPVGRKPELWDGRAAERIVAAISRQFL